MYHDVVASTRQGDPRAKQKARTRAAIVEAAQQLMRREGATPTIAEAAVHAGVSRATAYRYFPTQEALEVELADVSPAVASVETLVECFTTDDVEQRLLLLLDTFGPIALAEEERLRRALRVYLDTWLRNRREGATSPAPVREGRRMRWLEKVLEPVDGLPDERRQRLRAALALTLGIDSVVVMKDVCHLDDDETLAVLRWTATAILRAALEEGRSLDPS
jgi:AcrR family transcriptional regulator